MAYVRKIRFAVRAAKLAKLKVSFTRFRRHFKTSSLIVRRVSFLTVLASHFQWKNSFRVLWRYAVGSKHHCGRCLPSMVILHLNDYRLFNYSFHPRIPLLSINFDGLTPVSGTSAFYLLSIAFWVSLPHTDFITLS